MRSSAIGRRSPSSTLQARWPQRCVRGARSGSGAASVASRSQQCRGGAAQRDRIPSDAVLVAGRSIHRILRGRGAQANRPGGKIYTAPRPRAPAEARHLESRRHDRVWSSRHGTSVTSARRRRRSDAGHGSAAGTDEPSLAAVPPRWTTVPADGAWDAGRQRPLCGVARQSDRSKIVRARRRICLHAT